MNEPEWLTSVNSNDLLLYLGRQQVPEKRLRLLAAAFCRSIWDLLTDERSRNAVLVAERAGEGLADRAELLAAWRSAWGAIRDDRCFGERAAARAASVGSPVFTAHAATEAARARGREQARGVRCGRVEVKKQGTAAERHRQCDLIRCLLGNPFRKVALDLAWLTWNGGAAAAMARRIAEERRFADLPVLADALEDAGCADSDVLTHCRGPAPHAHGCWVLDLLVGKR
jgi:hypothetical protein